MTAVEWFIDNLKYIYPNAEEHELLIELAKGMEKRQIINAWRNGDNDSMYSQKELDKQAEEYYNETYKMAK